MFRIHHPLYLPITPTDDHPAIGRTLAQAQIEGIACLNRSPQAVVFEQPFICTRPAAHDQHHVAASRPGPQAGMPARMVTTDAHLVVAEWDDQRDTDGLA